jgi:kojibiose phosphorylase
VRNGQMTFKPWLPPGWKAIGFRLKWHGAALSVSASHTAATFVLSGAESRHETILVNGHEVTLPANAEVVVDLAKAGGPES